MCLMLLSGGWRRKPAIDDETTVRDKSFAIFSGLGGEEAFPGLSLNRRFCSHTRTRRICACFHRVAQNVDM